MKVLILGANGLLGSACMRIMGQRPEIHVVGTYRTKFDVSSSDVSKIQHYQLSDILDNSALEELFKNVSPDVVINCISLSKSDLEKINPYLFISTYSLLPHLLHDLCDRNNARLIQISSDGVFSGEDGNYSEFDKPDAQDVYGRSKLLGEVVSDSSITLRTSMIGESPGLHNGLISWFLDQRGSCKGYSEAIFSGFPVNVLAELILDHIIPNSNLSGIYHLASNPISKYDLLSLVAKRYKSSVHLIPDNSLKIDRSLNGDKFAKETNYKTPSWEKLVYSMYLFYNGGIK